MTTSPEDEILALCNRLGRAHYDKNADEIIACYAPEALLYSLAPPLGERGLNRPELDTWLATWEGPIEIEAQDTEVAVSQDLAYTSALNRMRGVKTDGTTVDLWFRTTMCFRTTDDGWRIVHDHSSVPFLMDGSERAALNLRP